MDKTIYWAVLLFKESKKLLLEHYKPRHENIYAGHITVVFNPTKEQDNTLMEKLGRPKVFTVNGFNFDTKGDAVVVAGVKRLDGGIPHITISCANNVKPFYSNELLQGGWEPLEPIVLRGIISRFTKNGWDKGKW